VVEDTVVVLKDNDEDNELLADVLESPEVGVVEVDDDSDDDESVLLTEDDEVLLADELESL
jgi:hypothetical protein